MRLSITKSLAIPHRHQRPCPSIDHGRCFLGLAVIGAVNRFEFPLWKGEVGDVSKQPLRDTGFVSFEEVIPSETVRVERVLPGPRGGIRWI